VRGGKKERDQGNSRQKVTKKYAEYSGPSEGKCFNLSTKKRYITPGKEGKRRDSQKTFRGSPGRGKDMSGGVPTALPLMSGGQGEIIGERKKSQRSDASKSRKPRGGEKGGGERKDTIYEAGGEAARPKGKLSYEEVAQKTPLWGKGESSAFTT